MTATDSNNSQLENKILQIMSAVLGIPTSTIRENASRESYSIWDSMKHVELVIAIETEFGFRLKGDEVGKMNSLDQMKSLVENKLHSSS